MRSLVALWLAFLPWAATAAHLRSSRSSMAVNQTTVASTTRGLAMSHVHFAPLDCNRGTCEETTWTAARYNPERNKVTIPCGVCVTMDYVGDEEQVLRLPHGLEVQGSLLFPNNYRLTIETPFIIVQGLLKMTAARKVTDTPLIQVNLTGTEEIAFLPIDNNADACPDANGQSGPCSVGIQPIVVAGGKVDLRGVPATCKTWTKLHSVVAVESAQEPFTHEFARPADVDGVHLNPLCRTYNDYIANDFEASAGMWTGGYGAHSDWSRGFLRVSDRKDALEHAPTLDMLAFRDCLIPDQTYLFAARVRLRHPSLSARSSTPCNEDGDDCLSLQSTTLRPGSRAGTRKGREFPVDEFAYGVWQNFYASFTFLASELHKDAIYQILRLRGPEPAVEIDIDDVTFGLPPPSLFPDPDNVCGGNLIMNGDAEAHAIHPYPMVASSGSLSVFTFQTGNRVFRVSGRSSDTDAVQYDLAAPQCVMTGAQYSVRARVRFVSRTPVASTMMVRIFFTDETSLPIEAATCEATGTTWDDCLGRFTVVDDFEPENVESVRVFFVTNGAPDITMDVDDWEMQVSRPAKSGIVVEGDGIVDCWGEGAEVVITSHTLDRNDAQVRQLVNSPVELENGLVRLDLDDFIIFPVTEVQDEPFAVEVALLNRNIRFQGGYEQSNKGGHFMVMHTPNVAQNIRGVEFRNFGRQGELGRYPIHMHLCENTPSTIDKNLVIDSNQRCVVIHGTHNTTVSDNVGFRSKGHCFMTEDGGEMDNRFIGNLGALTEPVTRIVRAGETDGFNPSTFWCSNPSNEWIGNVAAGSAANGFWFELQTSVRAPSSTFHWAEGINPRELPLKTFRDNVAHSNWRHGFRTYPHGFLPPSEAVFDNIRSYKNRQDGLFLRSSKNIRVTGGILADNMNQITFEIAQNIALDDIQLIGRTDRFREIVDTQDGVLSHDERMVGINLHVTTPDLLEAGALFNTVAFSKFHQDSAIQTALVDISVDNARAWDGIFNFWSSFENVIVDDMSTTIPFDLTQASDSEHAAVYLVDQDSTLNPTSTAVSTSSVVIADSDDVKAFVRLGRCELFEAQNYWYCRSTCLRTVIFAVDPSFSEDLLLEIVDTADPARLYRYTSHFASETLDNGSPDIEANTDWNKNRSYAAALPEGSYRVRFVRQGATPLTAIWPTFVETMWGTALCDETPTAQSITLVEPGALSATCADLIRNGDMQDRTITPWLHSFGAGIGVEVNEGRRGTVAIADLDQKTAVGGMGQYVDTRCLTVGSIYEIRVWVRLERPDGSTLACGNSACGPKLKMRLMRETGTLGEALERVISPLSTRLEEPVQSDWNLLYARVVVAADWAAAASVFVYVERGRTGAKLFLDDFSMTRV